MVTYRKYYNKTAGLRLHRILPRSKKSSWSRVIVIGILILSVYFLLLGFISYFAITSHRNTNGGVLRGIPFTLRKNGSNTLDVDYDLIRAAAASLNTSFLHTNNGLLALDRIGNRKFNTGGRRGGILGAELLRAQMIFRCTKSPIHFREPEAARPRVALVSFPGSGNTWFRYLLQLATGIYTGSVYKDFALLRNGFPGEFVKDGRVLVVKTHETGPLIRSHYERAILLVRRPQDAILAEFNRRNAGHIRQASRDQYRRAEGRLWSQFVLQKAQSWTETNLDWVEHFQGPLLIIMYSQLVANVSSELKAALDFLQEPVSEDVMSCVLRNQEGIYRRRKTPLRFNPFTPSMLRLLKTQEQLVAAAIEKRTSTNLKQVLLQHRETATTVGSINGHIR